MSPSPGLAFQGLSSGLLASARNCEAGLLVLRWLECHRTPPDLSTMTWAHVQRLFADSCGGCCALCCFYSPRLSLPESRQWQSPPLLVMFRRWVQVRAPWNSYRISQTLAKTNYKPAWLIADGGVASCAQPFPKLPHRAMALGFGWLWCLHLLMDCLCFAGVWKMQSEFRCRAQHMVGIEQAYEVRYVQVQRVLRPMFVKVKLEDWCPACSACQDLEPSCNITFSDGRPPYVCFARTGDGDIIRRFPVVASIGYYLVGFYFILSGIQLICSALGTCPLVASTVLAFLAAFAGGTGVICNLAPQRSTYLYIALGVILTHCLFLIVLIFMFEGHSIKLGWIDWYNLLAFALNTFGLKGPEVLAGFFEVDLLCCVPWLPRCFNQYGPQGWVPLDRAIFAQPFDRVGEMRSRQAAIPFIHDSDAEISDHKAGRCCN